MPNKFTGIDREQMNNIWSLCAVNYIKETVKENTDVDTIVFLGDVFDLPGLKKEQTIEFKEILDYILSFENIKQIKIIVGNHDCSSRKQNINKTPLRFFIGYNDKVQILFFTKVEFVNDRAVVYFPYRLREQVLPELYGIRNEVADKDVFLLTHNNIYIEESFKETQMTSFDEIKDVLGCANLFIMNGHIHIAYYETNYFQPGSINPTSFKFTPTASGIFKYDFITDEYLQFKNREVVFLAVNNHYYFEELQEILESAIQFKAAVFLKYTDDLSEAIEPLLRKYNRVIIGVKETTSRQ